MELHDAGDRGYRAGPLMRGPTTASWGSGQLGIGAIDLVLATAFVIVPFAMLLLSIPIQLEYRSMAHAAAREAARACATASDPVSGLRRAEAVAARIMDERGLPPAPSTVSVDCVSAWRPGGVVTAQVSLEVPAIRILDTWQVGSWAASAVHKESIERYRSLP